MTYLIKFIVCFIAGIGAGLGTGFAGMSAAAVISPMLITFLGMDPYMAVGIALASDVLASAISAYTYGKNGNLDIKNGAVMMAAVLCFTLVGSYVASLLPGTTMGGFSTFMTFLLGVKFIVRPVMTTKNAMNAVSAQKRFAQSLLCGAGVGFICGFVGAGGGMMMLLLLTSVLGYELKTAVGTSVFIMAFTAFTGSVSHFAIGGAPDLFCLVCCVLSTLLWARIAAKFANKAEPATLNRATGVVLVILGAVIMAVNYLEDCLCPINHKNPSQASRLGWIFLSCYFCSNSTRRVNHSFSQCRVKVPPWFSAAARTLFKSYPPWALRLGRPSAANSTGLAQ